MQFREARRHGEPGGQFVEIERLAEIVVGAHAHAIANAGFVAERSQEDKIRISAAGKGSDASAKLEAVHDRHRPVADDGIHLAELEQSPSFGAVAGGYTLVTELLDRRFEDHERSMVVLSDENAHGSSRLRDSNERGPHPIELLV